MRGKTYAFDNSRAFVSRSQGGVESGFEGWARIAAKGRRDFLPGIDPDRSALVVVDLQENCVHEWPEMIAKYDRELGEAYARRMSEFVIPNVTRLLDFFRKGRMLVVYLTLGEDAIIPAIAPSGNEVVVRKHSSGAFATSAFDLILREHGMATLFFAGVATNGCVSHTMSAAYDRSYQTILIEDACCGTRPDVHEAAVKIWAHKGFVRTADQVIDDYPWDCWVDPDVSDLQLARGMSKYW